MIKPSAAAINFIRVMKPVHRRDVNMGDTDG
jgi:hypothetical protein